MNFLKIISHNRSEISKHVKKSYDESRFHPIVDNRERRNRKASHYTTSLRLRRHQAMSRHRKLDIV